MVHWDKVMRSRREDQKGRAQIQTVVLISEELQWIRAWLLLLQSAVTTRGYMKKKGGKRVAYPAKTKIGDRP